MMDPRRSSSSTDDGEMVSTSRCRLAAGPVGPNSAIMDSKSQGARASDSATADKDDKAEEAEPELGWRRPFISRLAEE
jgi:hypothetical protein